MRIHTNTNKNNIIKAFDGTCLLFIDLPAELRRGMGGLWGAVQLKQVAHLRSKWVASDDIIDGETSYWVMARSERMVGALWGSSITVICSYFSLISKLGSMIVRKCRLWLWWWWWLLWWRDLTTVDSSRPEVHFLQDNLTRLASILLIVIFKENPDHRYV